MDVHCRPGTWKCLPMLLDLAVSQSQQQRGLSMVLQPAVSESQQKRGLGMVVHCCPGIWYGCALLSWYLEVSTDVLTSYCLRKLTTTRTQ